MTLELYYCFKEWAEKSGLPDTNQNLLEFLEMYHLLNAKRINKFFKEWANKTPNYEDYDE